MESWECATLVYEEEKKKGNSSLPFFLNFAPVFLSPPKAKQPIAMALTFGPPRPSSRYSMSSRQKGVQIWGENDESFVFFHSFSPSPKRFAQGIPVGTSLRGRARPALWSFAHQHTPIPLSPTPAACAHRAACPTTSPTGRGKVAPWELLSLESAWLAARGIRHSPWQGQAGSDGECRSGC